MDQMVIQSGLCALKLVITAKYHVHFRLPMDKVATLGL